MTTLPELLNSREVAGARYAAALAEFRASYVDLAAFDQALMNGNVRGLIGAPTHPGQTMPGAHFGQGASDIRSFGHALSGLSVFAHPAYAPNPGGDWFDEIRSRRDELIAAVTG